MPKTLFSKSWGRVLHQQVETYKNIAVSLRSFSVHFDRNFDAEGWSLGLGWLQVSFGTFSRARNIN